MRLRVYPLVMIYHLGGRQSNLHVYDHVCPLARMNQMRYVVWTFDHMCSLESTDNGLGLLLYVVRVDRVSLVRSNNATRNSVAIGIGNPLYVKRGLMVA